MKYGKMENGILFEAPSFIQIDDKVIYQPNYDTYTQNGYKPIIEKPYPEQTDAEENKLYIAQYIEENTRIIQTWTEAEVLPIADNLKNTEICEE